MDKGTAVNVPYLLAQYIFRHAEGRKRRSRIVIDMDELVRLCICNRLGDTWAWVAPGPERHQVASIGAAQADQEIPKEGVQADPIPVQAPQAPCHIG
ncbi:hypothetical protein Tco_1022947 [Tanacetum coccineum]